MTQHREKEVEMEAVDMAFEPTFHHQCASHPSITWLVRACACVVSCLQYLTMLPLQEPAFFGASPSLVAAAAVHIAARTCRNRRWVSPHVRNRHRQTERPRERQTETDRDRQTEKETETDRDRERACVNV